MSPGGQPDQLDKRILELLLEDARTPYLEIARMCEVSGATVHLRIQKLEKMGILKGSRLILDYKKLGLGVRAFLGLYLDKLNHYDDILGQLRKIPEITECHFTTGEYAIFLKVHCRSTDHLRDLLINELQAIPYVRRTETFISLEQNFQREPDLSGLFGGTENQASPE
ncbi:MAG: Lrp/AsnC ligand binding domain-containing protein [Bacteroidota bacterium]